MAFEVVCRCCGRKSPDLSTYPYLAIATEAGWKVHTIEMCVETRTPAHAEYECPECAAKAKEARK